MILSACWAAAMDALTNGPLPAPTTINTLSNQIEFFKVRYGTPKIIYQHKNILFQKTKDYKYHIIVQVDKFYLNLMQKMENMLNYKLEAQEAEPVSLTCLLAKNFQRRRFFNESANQKQDLSGGLVFLPLG